MCPPGANVPDLEKILAALELSEVNPPDLDSRLSSLQTHGFSPLDIVFSCNVCQEMLDSIYSESDGNRGLRSTPGSDNGTVVKLWLTECSHLTCAKHLEGVAFYPTGQLPRAPCPICSEEQGDSTPKILYAVHGLRDGEFDPHIPASYFQLPPAGLETSNSTRDGLKFQYLALIRFGTRIRERLRKTERERVNLQSEIGLKEERVARLTTLLEKAQSDNNNLQRSIAIDRQKIDRLERQKALLEAKVEDRERDVKKWSYWESRQAEITRYLDLLAPMAREHLAMREKLWKLGAGTPTTDYATELFGTIPIQPRLQHFDSGESHDDVAVEEYGRLGKGDVTGRRRVPTLRPATATQNISNRSTAQPAVEDMVEQARSRPDGPDKEQYRFGMKRQLPDTTDTSTRSTTTLGGIQKRRLLESRDIMPPPPLPLREGQEQQPCTMTAVDQGFNAPHRQGNGSLQQAALQQESSTGMPNQAFQRSNIGSQSTRHGRGSANVTTNAPYDPPRGFNDRYIGSWSIERSRTRDRSHEFGTRPHSPGPFLSLYNRQDGELDNLQRRRQQTQSSPFTSSPSTQRLTLPPTTSRTTNNLASRRGGQGLSANIHTSSPIAYGPPPYDPPRRPLPSLPIPISSRPPTHSALNRGRTSALSRLPSHPQRPGRYSNTNRAALERSSMLRFGAPLTQTQPQIPAGEIGRVRSSRQQLGTQSTSPFFNPTGNIVGAAPRTVTQALGPSTPRRIPPFLVDPRLSTAPAQDDGDDADDEAAGGSRGRGLFSASGRRGVRR